MTVQSVAMETVNGCG